MNLNYWWKLQKQIEEKIQQIDLDYILNLISYLLIAYSSITIFIIEYKGGDILTIPIPQLGHPLIMLYLSCFHLIAEKIGLYKIEGERE